MGPRMYMETEIPRIRRREKKNKVVKQQSTLYNHGCDLLLLLDTSWKLELPFTRKAFSDFDRFKEVEVPMLQQKKKKSVLYV